MTHSELAELILEWAKKRNEPFMTADAFNDVEEAESANDTSQAISLLYRKGLLARKKIDGVRFSYSLSANAPEGYEVNQPIGFAKAFANELKSEHETGTPHKNEMKQPVNEKPARKLVDEDPTKKAETQHIRITKEQEAAISQAVVGSETLEVPDGFVLRLQTPGGLVITITTLGAK